MSDSMYSWLAPAIGDDAEIVTANRRLARELRGEYDRQQMTLGRTAWRTAPVTSWQDWLHGVAASVADPASIPTKLDPASSALLLENCLRSQLPEGLPGIGGIARQAGQSWQRLSEWQVPVSVLQSAARSLDERAFARAIVEYLEQLRHGGWVDGAGMANLVGNLIEQDAVVVRKKIILAGFDRLSPAVRRIATALESAGCEVTVNRPGDAAARICVMSYDSMEAELRAAGAWAREILDKKPDASIAIVSPVLESSAAEISRLVREGLVPGWQYGGASYLAAANVSYGRKLADYPSIATALLLLRWACHGLTSRELSLVLRSRCIADHSTDGRSRLELRMRQFPDHLWSIEEFLGAFGGKDSGRETERFMQGVGELAKLPMHQPQQATPADWAGRIDLTLSSMGWPGDAALDSAEFQLSNRWRQLLNEFARLQTVMPRLQLSEACQRLTTLASETIFQPESGRGLVQILGALEAAGMEFDSVWVCGLDASQWPPPARPAIFIPAALQRKYRMPDASPGDTLEFAERVLERIVSSARTCVLSWATSRDDAELTHSSLLDRFAADNAKTSDPGWYASTLTATVELDVEIQDEAPPVAADEKIRGGAYTVQQQYLEPLDAFVSGRLGVRAPEPIMTGLSPGTRGNIVHSALHTLLLGRPTRTEFMGWSPEQLDRKIGSAIDSALAEHVRRADPVLLRLLSLERSRLRNLLLDFAAAELLRPDFVVVDVEKEIHYNAFGVRLALRIDRIDRLANGRLLVIDYKTGQPKHFLDRNGKPTDLQLIVYADALDADVGGLALINIDSRTISYKGIGADGGNWKPLDDADWSAMLSTWRSLVHKTLQEFSAGDVRMNMRASTSESRPLSLLSRKEEQKRAD